MNIIKVLDKEFASYISQEKIEGEIHRVAKEITRDMEGRDPLFLVMLNGAFMFAGELFKNIDIPCEISFVKYKSYSGTQCTNSANVMIGAKAEDVRGRNIVIVEDLIDSGFTMSEFRKDLEAAGAKSISIATMMFKPNAFKFNYKVDYIGLNIGNEFIVGYGLDYNEYGRNLREIYKIVE
ncbi:MAG: hypoxanthine phosphoribosyltransferase [Bacteroidales bacterium]|nr:hypoxanthine phosphoribosyltransferase [Bacteroidales bacterium]